MDAKMEKVVDADVDVDVDVQAAKLTKETSLQGQQFSEELLRQYYKRIFPYDAMFRWLSYFNDPDKAAQNSAIVPDYFARREVSFTLDDDGEEIYIRYLSFRDEAGFRAELQKKQPRKIDFGAVYSHPPKEHKTIKASQFKPVERELVFDVDLDDYKQVGSAGADISKGMGQECWYFMAATIKVVDTLLREDFGFKHLLWIYSGRRGVHCWVCDESARKLENSAREAIVKYLSVVEESTRNKNAVNLTTPMHPSVERVYPALEEIFFNSVIGEGPLSRNLLADGNTEGWDEILAHVPDENVAARLKNAWLSKSLSPKSRWLQLKKTCEAQAEHFERKQTKQTKEANAFATCAQAIVIYFTYPRLDVEVSKKRNHLLKSPWCVHPKTGRVCVPINPKTVDSFDPHTVPTLVTLFNELDSFKPAGAGGDDGAVRKRQRISDLDKTSLRSFMQYFEDSFLTPLYADAKAGWKQSRDRLAAATNSW